MQQRLKTRGVKPAKCCRCSEKIALGEKYYKVTAPQTKVRHYCRRCKDYLPEPPKPPERR